jgi:outer membrane protein OmpA-like peptidoglycan-associated protein
MAKPRSGHLIIGVGLAVMGYAVLVIAFSRQAERARAGAEQGARVANASGSGDTVPAAVAAPLTAIEPLLGDAGDRRTSGSATPAVGAAGAADAATEAERADGSEAPDVRVFRFYPGGVGLSRDEALRLAALCKAAARQPTAKLTIEAFGDTIGNDPPNAGLAKHRLKVAETLLTRAGVPEDRFTLVTGDVATDARLARTMRVTSTPPLTEVEKP